MGTVIEGIRWNRAGERPDGAVAAIVAELHENVSDTQSDYFAHRTTRRVVLAWSKHTRNVFSEMRKAASTFEETRHLGPGCDLYRVRVELAEDVDDGTRSYYAGERSHWHSELPEQSFFTLAEAEAFVASAPAPESLSFGDHLATFRWSISRESIEHREAYSMGDGYYLKVGHSDATGWTVRKTWDRELLGA